MFFKPENILLRHPRRSAIKIIDFSSACRTNERVCFQVVARTRKKESGQLTCCSFAQMYKYIQSRFYRAPEVLLELKYSFPIDIWSLGCILVEMHTGEPLFAGKDEDDQVRAIAQLCGVPPASMILQSSKAKKFFVFGSDGFMLRSPPSRSMASRNLAVHANTSLQQQLELQQQLKKQHDRRQGSRSLEHILGVHSGGPGGRRANDPGHSPADYLTFVDLVKRMLAYKPGDRITPWEALDHPFFKAGLPPFAPSPSSLSLAAASSPSSPSSSSAAMAAAVVASTATSSATSSGFQMHNDNAAIDDDDDALVDDDESHAPPLSASSSSSDFSSSDDDISVSGSAAVDDDDDNVVEHDFY
jgi:dual specificity tyrosine-phosphorylation-regulated kinase 1